MFDGSILVSIPRETPSSHAWLYLLNTQSLWSWNWSGFCLKTHVQHIYMYICIVYPTYNVCSIYVSSFISHRLVCSTKWRWCSAIYFIFSYLFPTSSIAFSPPMIRLYAYTDKVKHFGVTRSNMRFGSWIREEKIVFFIQPKIHDCSWQLVWLWSRFDRPIKAATIRFGFIVIKCRKMWLVCSWRAFSRSC